MVNNWLKYKRIVEDNKIIFNDLDKELKSLSLDLKKISKKLYKNRMIQEFDKNTGLLKYKTIEKTISYFLNDFLKTYKVNKTDYNSLKTSILIFISNDVSFLKKINKYYYEKFLNKLSKKEEVFNNMNTSYSNFLFGFSYLYRSPNEFVEDMSLCKTQQSILSNYKNKNPKYKSIYDFILLNISIFPMSTQKEWIKLKNENVDTINVLENRFHYKIFLKNLPKKINVSFVKKELGKFESIYDKYEDDGKLMTSLIYIYEAIIEKYGIEQIKNNNLLLEMFFIKIISKKRKFTNKENKNKNKLKKKEFQDLILNSVNNRLLQTII